MKVISLLFVTFCLSPGSFAKLSPKEKVSRAQKSAAAEKKDILMIFVASEWQKSSQEFEEKVLHSEVFQKELKAHFVQVVLSYPRLRSAAHQELLELQQKYRFREMPSVVLTDSRGRPYAYLDARERDPLVYLNTLATFRKKRIQRDQLFSEAADTEGVERAKLLIKGLKEMPQTMIRDFYSPELMAIVRADSGGETAYVKEVEEAEDLRIERELYGMLFRNKEYAEVIKKAKETASQLKGENAQRLKLYEIQALTGLEKFTEAVQELESMVQMAPDSNYAKRFQKYLTSIESSRNRSLATKKRSQKSSKHVVSKPIAMVLDMDLLKKEAEEARIAAEKAVKKEDSLKKEVTEVFKKMADAEAELEILESSHKQKMEILKEASIERERLTRRAEAMKDVVENHEAMASRKQGATEPEKERETMKTGE